MKQIKKWNIAIVAMGWLLVLSACSPQPPAIRPPTPTPPIRHRDALPLLLSLDDLGVEYTLVEQHRLNKGAGWTPDITRLSGYRHVYQGNQARYARVVSQVECYLSAQEAQIAYRTYKGQLTEQIKNDSQYGPLNEGEARLGEWSTMLTISNKDNPDLITIHYVFVRENVVIEVGLTGWKGPDFNEQALKTAQIVDKRVAAR